MTAKDSLHLSAEEIERAKSIINEAAPGTYNLKKLYAKAWLLIDSPTNFGMRFRRSVEAGHLPSIFANAKNSANALLYNVKGG